MEIRTELIDELLKDYQKPEDIIGENGLLKRFVKAVLERAMTAELTHHLGYQKNDPGLQQRKFAERDEQQDPQRRFRRIGDRGYSGSRGHV